jgi:hypothetical protein
MLSDYRLMASGKQSGRQDEAEPTGSPQAEE